MRSCKLHPSLPVSSLFISVPGIGSADGACEWLRVANGGWQPPPRYSDRACSCRSCSHSVPRCRRRHHASGTDAARSPAPICMARPTGSARRNDWDVTQCPCQWSVWGCPSFFVSCPSPILFGIHDTDYPLVSLVNVDVTNIDGLGVSTAVPVQGFD